MLLRAHSNRAAGIRMFVRFGLMRPGASVRPRGSKDASSRARKMGKSEMRAWVIQIALTVGGMGLLPSAVFGQGAIGGAVRDTSGGVPLTTLVGRMVQVGMQ